MFEVEATLKVMQSFLNKTGFYSGVEIGEPFSPPDAKVKLFAAIQFSNLVIGPLTLTAPIEIHVMNVRLFRDMLDQPGKDAELVIAKGIQAFLNTLIGQFTLEQNVRTVDFAGMYGTPVSAKTGHMPIAGHSYRTADIVVPLIVDNDADDDVTFRGEGE